jgi:hypothetical protein
MAMSEACQSAIPTLTMRIAIVYAAIAMNAAWPKFNNPANPNWTCNPSAKIV